MTVDKICTEAKNLNTEDFNTLLDGLLVEKKERDRTAKREAWNAVWEAICYYTDQYGDIMVSRDHMGYHKLVLSAELGFQSPTEGEIEIT